MWIEKFITNSKGFGIEYSDPNDYLVFLEDKGLYVSKVLSPCVICNELTGFTSDATGYAVCSDTCKDVDKNNAIAVMKYARLRNQDAILIKKVNFDEAKATGINIYEKDEKEVEVHFDDICMVCEEICKSIIVE